MVFERGSPNTATSHATTRHMMAVPKFAFALLFLATFHSIGVWGSGFFGHHDKCEGFYYSLCESDNDCDHDGYKCGDEVQQCVASHCSCRHGHVGCTKDCRHSRVCEKVDEDDEPSVSENLCANFYYSLCNTDADCDHEGYDCSENVAECVASACSCDPETGSMGICTADCNNSRICVPSQFGDLDDEDDSDIDGEDDGPVVPVCGGIAGLMCDVGYVCETEDDYPDAMGICVEEAEELCDDFFYGLCEEDADCAEGYVCGDELLQGIPSACMCDPTTGMAGACTKDMRTSKLCEVDVNYTEDPDLCKSNDDCCPDSFCSRRRHGGENSGKECIAFNDGPGSYVEDGCDDHTHHHHGLDDCICLDVWDPVCSFDGQTYSNACRAQCDMVFLYFPGECWENEDPQCLCFDIYEPVCGRDRVTYSNSCEAECVGMEIVSYMSCDSISDEEWESFYTNDDFDFDGVCPDVYEPVCTATGTKSNECEANGEDILHEGMCCDDVECPDGGTCRVRRERYTESRYSCCTSHEEGHSVCRRGPAMS